MVDFDALWKIVLAAFAAGVGGVAALLLVIAGTTRVERGRRQATIATGVVGWTMTAAGLALLAGALVVGFLAMTHK